MTWKPYLVFPVFTVQGSSLYTRVYSLESSILGAEPGKAGT